MGSSEQMIGQGYVMGRVSALDVPPKMSAAWRSAVASHCYEGSLSSFIERQYGYYVARSEGRGALSIEMWLQAGMAGALGDI